MLDLRITSATQVLYFDAGIWWPQHPANHLKYIRKSQGKYFFTATDSEN